MKIPQYRYLHSSDLYSLFDYKDFREKMDLEKAYLQGRFDAVPYINEFVDLVIVKQEPIFYAGIGKQERGFLYLLQMFKHPRQQNNREVRK